MHFAYTTADGIEKVVQTLEELEYPNYYHRTVSGDAGMPSPGATDTDPAAANLTATTQPGAAHAGGTQQTTTSAAKSEHVEALVPATVEQVLKDGHIAFVENQRGVSFDRLFGPYLKGASKITITDPYIRLFHQLRNLMELMETIARNKATDDEIKVHLITVEDEYKGEQQTEYLGRIVESCAGIGIQFTWEYDTTGTRHDRDITTDHGWKIVLSRGLDVFQRFEMNDAFSFSNRMQQLRPCKEFNVTFVRI